MSWPVYVTQIKILSLSMKSLGPLQKQIFDCLKLQRQNCLVPTIFFNFQCRLQSILFEIKWQVPFRPSLMFFLSIVFVQLNFDTVTKVDVWNYVSKRTENVPCWARSVKNTSKIVEVEMKTPLWTLMKELVLSKKHKI